LIGLVERWNRFAGKPQVKGSTTSLLAELQEDVMLFVHSNILVQLTDIILLKTEVKTSILQYEKLCMQSHAYIFCKKLTQLKTSHTAALSS
jgi:hypothetical protein